MGIIVEFVIRETPYKLLFIAPYRAKDCKLKGLELSWTGYVIRQQ